MNEVKLEGTLTKEPYKAAKGWVGATLAIKQPGKDFSLWVSLYVPAGKAADAFSGAQKNERYMVEGELDETKDRETGARKLQVKVLTAQRVKPNQHDVYITDDDLPPF